jgi:hypothetical protein
MLGSGGGLQKCVVNVKKIEKNNTFETRRNGGSGEFFSESQAERGIAIATKCIRACKNETGIPEKYSWV